MVLGHERAEYLRTPKPMVKDLAERINDIRTIRNCQGLDGTWNSSEYMRGLYNGIELALCTLEGDRDPEYKGPPQPEQE